jgi:hypothetical protein
MKTTQILYLALFIIVILIIYTSSSLLDNLNNEGFQNTHSSEPVIAKSLEEKRLPIQAMPNESQVSQLPYGPYAQTASVGSFPYKDPSELSANPKQLAALYEDVRSFLVFEGVSISDSSDPTVQLPLTQLRADSEKLEQELTVLKRNPGIESSLTQQNLADIEGSLTFLQKKVRLFQNAGVISGETEGFQNVSKKRATEADLKLLQSKVYSAILVLSSSGTTDPVVQARIKALQAMYSAVSDMIKKVNTGIMDASAIPLFEEDINSILPNLGSPSISIGDLFSTNSSSTSTSTSGQGLNPVQNGIASLVGSENAANVLKLIQEKGMFRVNVDMGFNTIPGSQPIKYSTSMNLGSRPENKNDRSQHQSEDFDTNIYPSMKTNSAFDSSTLGMDDRADYKSTNSLIPGSLDWKKRTTSICEQVRLRGLDPQDFGCIPEGSLMSPAYSWRGHAKMVCGRLGATLDPNLPVACGCPPQNWKGWGNF